MANKIRYVVKTTNTTKSVEYWNPFTNQYQDENPILNVPAGSYTGLKARLKGSNPAIIATYSGSVTVIDAPKLTAPSALVLTAMDSSTISVMWTNNSEGVAGLSFVVEASAFSDFSSDIITKNTINNTFVFTGLLANTLYYVRVKAIAYNYNESTYTVETISTPVEQSYTIVQGADFQGIPKVYLYVDESVTPINTIDKHPATMKIVNDSRTTHTDLYDGKINIRIRGNSTAGYPKKPYAITTLKDDGSDNSVSILGGSTGSDWCLLADYNDRGNMNNFIALSLGKKLNNGVWNPTPVKVEVYYNDNLTGLYTWCEKIKQGATRVNVEKLTATDTTSPAVTGGYIVEQVWVEQEKPEDVLYSTPIWSKPPYINKVVGSIYRSFASEYPKTTDIKARPAQLDYIRNYINAAESSIYNYAFTDTVNGYKSYFELIPDLDYYFLREFFKDVDSASQSIFFQKKRSGKLIPGPIWDFDQGMFVFNDMVHPYLSDPTGLYMMGHPWWKKKFSDKSYRTAAINRFNTIKPIISAAIDALEKNYQVLMSNGAGLRDTAIWFTNSEHSFEDFAIAKVDFARKRLAWMSTYFSASNNEELIDDPNFTTSKDWLALGNGVSINSQGANIINSSYRGVLDANPNCIVTDISTVPGMKYKLVINVSDFQGGILQLFSSTNITTIEDTTTYQFIREKIPNSGTHTFYFTSFTFSETIFLAGDDNILTTATIRSLSCTPVYVDTTPINNQLIFPNNEHWLLTSYWRDFKYVPTIVAGRIASSSINIATTNQRIAISNYVTNSAINNSVVIDGNLSGTLTNIVNPLVISLSSGNHLIDIVSNQSNNGSSYLPFITILRENNSPLPIPADFTGVVGASTGGSTVVLDSRNPKRVRYVNGESRGWDDNGNLIYAPYFSTPFTTYEQTEIFLPVDGLVKYYFISDAGGDRGLFDLVINGIVAIPERYTNDELVNGTVSCRMAIALPAGRYTLKMRKGNSKSGYLSDLTLETI